MRNSVDRRAIKAIRRIKFLSAKTIIRGLLRVLILNSVNEIFFYAYDKIVFFDGAYSNSSFGRQACGYKKH